MEIQFKMSSQNMKVKLVSITKPVMHNNIKNPEDLIVYCARVSNPKNQLNTDTSSKLISYLIKHSHWSPFEMVDMCVEIKTSRAIAAQILRHRSFSFQEFSQRYSALQDFDWNEEIELRKQGKTNRQGGEEELSLHDQNGLAQEISDIFKKVKMLYDKLIDKGIAKECARMILPLSTSTTLYMKGSIRSWIHYINLRSQKDTQKEHRLIAEECKKIFISNFPNVSVALNYE